MEWKMGLARNAGCIYFSFNRCNPASEHNEHVVSDTL